MSSDTGGMFLVGYILGLCTWFSYAISRAFYEHLMAKKRGEVVSFAEAKAALRKGDE